MGTGGNVLHEEEEPVRFPSPCRGIPEISGDSRIGNPAARHQHDDGHPLPRLQDQPDLKVGSILSFSIVSFSISFLKKSPKVIYKRDQYVSNE